jgi:hypothetical protein
LKTLLADRERRTNEVRIAKGDSSSEFVIGNILLKNDVVCTHPVPAVTGCGRAAALSGCTEQKSTQEAAGYHVKYRTNPMAKYLP